MRAKTMELQHCLAKLLLCANILLITAVPTVPSRPRLPALLVFGDSIVDPGNNNNLITIAKGNLPPYGRDFPGHKPTGRFSNGRIPPDIIASELGIKELLPAYLDPDLKEEDILTGVSFASGAAGFDNLTALIPNVLSMWDQLELYKEYKGKLEGIAGPARAAEIISESPHIIFCGSNDILVSYFFTGLRQLSFDLPSYINFVINAARSFITELYELGARRIGVIGLPPLGCIPSSRTIMGGINRECVQVYNDAAISFNAQLSASLRELNKNLPTALVLYLDIYDVLFNLIQHAADYGFEESTRGCCATGLVEASIFCNELSPFTCPETETYKYLFWDGFHPTQRAYNIIIPPLVAQFQAFLIPS
ncbi:GDSL esterase/lipase EXL3-like [Canna indica]|uniref:GDSL esterase/lipase EXL3-like n=1 Tax=Canna indica TaxID=4628 RepID=A0AAQ3JPI6_9LILI|nr:GDSL esterase/lipase EXL3-like [Canna indica]